MKEEAAKNSQEHKDSRGFMANSEKEAARLDLPTSGVRPNGNVTITHVTGDIEKYEETGGISGTRIKTTKFRVPSPEAFASCILCHWTSSQLSVVAFHSAVSHLASRLPACLLSDVSCGTRPRSHPSASCLLSHFTPLLSISLVLCLLFHSCVYRIALRRWSTPMGPQLSTRYALCTRLTTHTHSS